MSGCLSERKQKAQLTASAQRIGQVKARVQIDNAPPICRKTEPEVGLKLGDDLGSKFKVARQTIRVLNGRLISCADLWDTKAAKLR